jgi:hypothetical protein
MTEINHAATLLMPIAAFNKAGPALNALLNYGYSDLQKDYHVQLLRTRKDCRLPVPAQAWFHILYDCSNIPAQNMLGEHLATWQKN